MCAAWELHSCFILTLTLQWPTWMVCTSQRGKWITLFTSMNMVGHATSHLLHHVCYALDTCGAKSYALFHPFPSCRDLCLITITIQRESFSSHHELSSSFDLRTKHVRPLKSWSNMQYSIAWFSDHGLKSEHAPARYNFTFWKPDQSSILIEARP